VIRFLHLLLGLTLMVSLVLPAAAQRKKKKGDEEPPTQVLEVLPDPPSHLTVETSRLGFLISPLSTKGLLSQQTRDAIKALQKLAKGAQIVKLRAFVAGTGDMRRVPSIVAEEFTSKRQPLPVVSVVQVGQLPIEGAQVLIEATLMERRSANPHGIALLAGQQVRKDEKTDNPLESARALVAKSIDQLDAAAKGAGVAPGGMLRVTCLISSLAEHSEIASLTASRYPGAAVAIVQLQRAPGQPIAECEGVGRLAADPPAAIVHRDPEGLPKSPNYSQAILVNAPRIVLTGSQLVFGGEEKDVRLAFDRLGRILEQAKVNYRDVIWTSYYPLTNNIFSVVSKVRFDFVPREKPPASTAILFEGLPSVDARCGIELIAVAP
jgi:enamine deaminase RidA (YjgF/YER057c/UK114 family)